MRRGFREGTLANAASFRKLLLFQFQNIQFNKKPGGHFEKPRRTSSSMDYYRGVDPHAMGRRVPISSEFDIKVDELERRLRYVSGRCGPEQAFTWCDRPPERPAERNRSDAAYAAAKKPAGAHRPNDRPNDPPIDPTADKWPSFRRKVVCTRISNPSAG